MFSQKCISTNILSHYETTHIEIYKSDYFGENIKSLTKNTEIYLLCACMMIYLDERAYYSHLLIGCPGSPLKSLRVENGRLQTGGARVFDSERAGPTFQRQRQKRFFVDTEIFNRHYSFKFDLFEEPGQYILVILNAVRKAEHSETYEPLPIVTIRVEGLYIKSI